MKSEDGTGSRHALRVLKEMWDCHPTYFIQLYGQVTSVTCLFIIKPPACQHRTTVIFIHFFKEDDVMKIKKLPSGSYRIRKMYKGKMYTVITDYKPTQKDAINLMSDELKKAESKALHLTFQRTAEN